MELALKVEYVPLESIRGYKNNAKEHTKSQIEQIAESIQHFGFNDPIGVWNNEIVEGHGRLAAAKTLNLQEVPIIRLDHLSDADRKIYILTHNKLTLNTGFDIDRLAIEMEELKNLGANLSLTGFDAAEIDDLFSQIHNQEVQEDTFDVDAALEEEPVSKPGDLWLLGPHRLLCGDSTKKESYAVLMDGKKANLVVTDPPYNIDIQGGTKDALKIKNDNMPDAEFYGFLLKFYQCSFEVMADGAAIYVFHADTEGINFRTAFKNAGFHLSGVCIWVKNSLVLSRSDYHFRHEPILYGFKATAKHKWYSDRKQDTIWNFDRPRRSDSHPTMKPIPLVAYSIRNSSPVNGIVLDPFGGSGTTLIACEQLDRICYTIELDGRYMDVIVKRYIEYKESSEEVYLLRDGKKIAYTDAMERNNKESAKE